MIASADALTFSLVQAVAPPEWTKRVAVLDWTLASFTSDLRAALYIKPARGSTFDVPTVWVRSESDHNTSGLSLVQFECKAGRFRMFSSADYADGNMTGAQTPLPIPAEGTPYSRVPPNTTLAPVLDMVCPTK